MTTAFVLSGGGSLGSVQVGMLAALAERAYHPDMLIGTSVGALNAAFVCQNGGRGPGGGPGTGGRGRRSGRGERQIW